MTKNIPIHSIKDINKLGIEIKRLVDVADIMEIEKKILGAHRDDHYLFFFQQSGRGDLMVDFKEIKSIGACLFFILPGQVHQVMAIFNCTGWFLAVASEYINENYRSIFEELTIAQQRTALNSETAKQLDQTLMLLEGLCNGTSEFKFKEQLIRSLVDASIGFYASTYAAAVNEQQTLLRPAIITRKFRMLLRENFKEIKNPTAYANLLNISPAYLNEVVKQSTGFSVSYWIHQEIMMEAKRLLYYTNSSVKEIAHALGFTDHAYFSRLFSKTVAQSPVQFRNHYRE